MVGGIRNSGGLGVAVATAIAALVIGCGGSGDGGSTGITSTATIATGTTATATTATASTSTATTSTATTSTGTTSGDPGVLPKNKIFYDELKADAIEYRYIDPTGSGDTLYASLPFNFSGFSPNPVVASQYFFGAQPAAGSKWRIYRNSTISLSGAVSQTPNVSYDSIDGLQVANNGAFLIFLASSSGSASRMYYLELKSPLPDPVLLDDADRFHISPLSNQVVYSKPVGGRGGIFTRPLPTGSATKVIDVDGKEDFDPQFNKDASKIVFSSDRNGPQFDLYVAKVDGTDVQRITDTPDVSEAGASFNEAGTEIAYVASGATTSLNRLPVAGSAVVLKESAGLNGTRWTGSDGKAKANGPNSFNVGLTPKKRPKSSTKPTDDLKQGLNLYRPDRD